MNKSWKGLLAGAIVSGVLSANVARADETAPKSGAEKAPTTPPAEADKAHCGTKDHCAKKEETCGKNGCGGKKPKAGKAKPATKPVPKKTTDAPATQQ